MEIIWHMCCCGAKGDDWWWCRHDNGISAADPFGAGKFHGPHTQSYYSTNLIPIRHSTEPQSYFRQALTRRKLTGWVNWVMLCFRFDWSNRWSWKWLYKGKTKFMWFLNNIILIGKTLTFPVCQIIISVNCRLKTFHEKAKELKSNFYDILWIYYRLVL